ncbi:MAG: protoheme IX farnesyltransferase [Candidatus Poseidoniales archaeon]|nr:MAG: protoheme IX farnesyltransferase [Candidatus Poseidoniales archaeon]|tara:strand:+ start:1073 stop:2197 length:1125 start_codon:yes stop_codon:yes gene_type:complete
MILLLNDFQRLLAIGVNMSEARALVKSLFSLTKPRVVVLLQITAMCAILCHDLIESNKINRNTLEIMFIVFIGGYLTAGGANCINMWYDRDIDPIMIRTSKRPLSVGDISPQKALLFGISISIIGTLWLLEMANEVAAFWALFSILFYVFIYTIWLKRTSVQNIVIGGIAGSTPPVIGWAAAEGELDLAFDTAENFIDSIVNIGGYMPWFMFLLIFLWTPPHFWALALYRSEEYEKVGVPMMPNVKGKERTLIEMKIYTILLIILSLTTPLAYQEQSNWSELPNLDLNIFLVIVNSLILSIWYGATVWKINTEENNDENNRMPTASHSFFVSLTYLAVMFIILVLTSSNYIINGTIISTVFILYIIFRKRGGKE